MENDDIDEDGIRTCTKEKPYSKERNNPPSRWIHPDAMEISGSQKDNYPLGDTVRYKCPYCDIEFKIELPQ